MRRKIKVTPNAKKNSLRKEHDLFTNEEVWYVKLVAAPIQGAANKALIVFLSQYLDIPKRKITLIHGDTSRWKVIEISE